MLQQICLGKTLLKQFITQEQREGITYGNHAGVHVCVSVCVCGGEGGHSSNRSEQISLSSKCKFLWDARVGWGRWGSGVEWSGVGVCLYSTCAFQ